MYLLAEDGKFSMNAVCQYCNQRVRVSIVAPGFWAGHGSRWSTEEAELPLLSECAGQNKLECKHQGEWPIWIGTKCYCIYSFQKCQSPVWRISDHPLVQRQPAAGQRWWDLVISLPLVLRLRSTDRSYPVWVENQGSCGQLIWMGCSFSSMGRTQCAPAHELAGGSEWALI